MANSSIEIEIVADFKDNATGKVKALNAELDKLEKRYYSNRQSLKSYGKHKWQIK